MSIKAGKNNPDARQRPFHLRVASLLRWVHTYLSMFALLLILFFSLTGITLNHQDWFFAKEPQQKQTEGTVSAEWLDAQDPAGAKVDKLSVVEALRKQGAHGAVEEFRIDEQECMVSFKAPGYSADTYIQRETGKYQMTTMEEGFIAAMNDLHKGKSAGKVWTAVVDISAAFLTIISLTGLGLIYWLKKIRTQAILTVVGGIVVVILLIRFFVP